MIPVPFEYQRATSVEDAIAKLGASGGKLVAGGHSLVPLMKLRLSEPAVLIDVARIPELRGIRLADGRIEIGAATTHHDIAASDAVREACPALAETAASIGDPQVRNRGTIGGSLAHADPAADYPAAMLALDATIRIRGPQGARQVAAADFFQAFFTVDLATDEIITGVQVAAVRTAAYAKLRQRASHFAIVGVCAALVLDAARITAARVGVTGAGPHASRLTAVEEALAGQPATPDALRAAAAAAALGDVNADIHGSEAYRRAMLPVFTRRALEAAAARA